jgi:hypothetical protein
MKYVLSALKKREVISKKRLINPKEKINCFIFFIPKKMATL